MSAHMPLPPSNEGLELRDVELSHGPRRTGSLSNIAQHLDPGVLQGLAGIQTVPGAQGYYQDMLGYYLGILGYYWDMLGYYRGMLGYYQGISGYYWDMLGYVGICWDTKGYIGILCWDTHVVWLTRVISVAVLK